MGGDVVKRGQPGSPGPTCAKGLLRQPAPYLNAYGFPGVETVEIPGYFPFAFPGEGQPPEHSF